MKAYGFFQADNNPATITGLKDLAPDYVIIEKIKNYGMPMSDFILDTCRVSGALEAFCRLSGLAVSQAPRKTIVTGLCGASTAKDSNVKSFLLDYFREYYTEATGGGRERLVGTKKRPGPFIGFVGKENDDLWAALAVATYGVLNCKKN